MNKPPNKSNLFTGPANDLHDLINELERDLNGMVDCVMHHIKPPNFDDRVKVKYCLGFIFDPAFSRVLLIVKKRPSWQTGLLNGIGGKIEIGESDLEAMNREFHEETGLDLPARFGPESAHTFTWHEVGRRARHSLFDNKEGTFELVIYAGTLCLNAMKKAKSTTDEVVIAVPLNYQILEKKGVEGLTPLILMSIWALKSGFTFHITDPSFLD